MSELLVVTGPSGAGKSTVAQVLAGEFELSAVVTEDAFFAMADRGYPDPWTEAAHRQTRSWSAPRAQRPADWSGPLRVPAPEPLL